MAHGLGGIERIEHAVEIAEAGAGIAEAHYDFLGLQVSLDHDFLLRSLLHGLRGVREEVDEDLLELPFIDGNARQVRGKVQFKTDPRPPPLILAKHQGIAHHDGDVQRLAAVLQRARKTDQVVDNFLHAPGFGSQSLQLLPRAIFRGLFFQQVGVAHDRG